MRSKNPFSDESGEEEGSVSETRAGEAEGDDAPADDARADDDTSADVATSDDDTRTDDDASNDDDDDASAEADTGGNGNGAGKERDQELPTAPSIGPNTVIDKPPPEERLDFDKISDEDAMGKDKRREVVGKTYGPTKARVLGTFAAFLAIVAALAVGFYFLAQELDQPPSENPDVAPWSAADAPQKSPRPLQ